jgi:hypothetical protein
MDCGRQGLDFGYLSHSWWEVERIAWSHGGLFSRGPHLVWMGVRLESYKGTLGVLMAGVTLVSAHFVWCPLLFRC